MKVHIRQAKSEDWKIVQQLNNQLFQAYKDNVENCKQSIITLCEAGNKNAQYLDCGCDNGDFTLQVAKKIKTKKLFGIEINPANAKIATERGVEIKAADLNKRFPYPNNSFDVITANQVIEHLTDTDHFAKEIKRVLKPEGYAIISTNNLSSWHNVVSLMLGFQPFPSDVSNTSSIGKLYKLSDNEEGSLAHLRIFTMKALIEFFKHHGFTVEEVVGVGYYPFPTNIASFFLSIDKNHSVYTTLKIRPV